MNVQPGTYVLTAKVTATKTNSPPQTATTNPVTITVNAAPDVAFTSPMYGRGEYPIPTSSTTAEVTASDIDGSIAKVEFFNCSTNAVLATLTTPPYTYVWNLPPPYYDGSGWPVSYDICASATDNLGGVTVASAVAEEFPTVSITSPANGSSFATTATIPLAATVAPADFGIASVDYFNGETLLGSSNTPPYSFNLQGLAPGTYAITAYANSIGGYSFPSQETTITVSDTPSLYFLQVDHLDTPRLVANAAGTTVWKWDQQEPFGDNVADENPGGLGAFHLPLRLPGQMYDSDTNLTYNYHRDYDQGLGRYVEPDPLGILHRSGGERPFRMNDLYSYVRGMPLTLIDPLGLEDKQCTGDICVEVQETLSKNLVYFANSPLRKCKNRCLLQFVGATSLEEGGLHQLHRFGELAGRASIVVSLITVPIGMHEVEKCIDECQNLRCVAPGTHP